MHALALEFTYLRKLNTEHWLKVWTHTCIWPQLWTGTSAWTHAHAHTHSHANLTLNSWECLQCEWVIRFPLCLTQWPMHCLCLHCTKLKQRVFPSPLPFKHTLRVAFVKTHTNWEGLASGRTQKTRAKFIEKSSRISEMHLIHLAPCFLLWQLIMFGHSNQGHRDINCSLFHIVNNGSHENKPKRSRDMKFSPPFSHLVFLLSHKEVKKNMDKQWMPDHCCKRTNASQKKEIKFIKFLYLFYFLKSL